MAQLCSCFTEVIKGSDKKRYQMWACSGYDRFLETRLINNTLMLDSICHNNESKISLKTHVVIIYGK